MATDDNASKGYRKHFTLLTFVCILLIWIAAWVLKLALDAHSMFFIDRAVSFVYWTIAKMIVWILPSIYLIKKTGRTIRGVFSMVSVKKMLVWGLSLGGLLVMLNAIAHFINHTPMIASDLSFSFVNAVIISPVFEEFTMRGAVLGGLRQRYSFSIANTITAVLFVLLHFPGWFFANRLMENMFKPLGGALSIFVIGWLCGLAAKRSETIVGAMIVHLLNNLTA